MQRAKDMQFKYWLPDENNEKQEYETDKNAVIIVGANGSGKSKLGAWIEQQSMDLVHRFIERGIISIEQTGSQPCMGFHNRKFFIS